LQHAQQPPLLGRVHQAEAFLGREDRGLCGLDGTLADGDFLTGLGNRRVSARDLFGVDGTLRGQPPIGGG